MSAAYRNYKIYIGKDFRWTHIKSSNPEVESELYVQSVPSRADRLAVVGTKRIRSTEDITGEYINNWILLYTKSLIKKIEGNTLRKSSIVGITNDGQELYNEGKTEAIELQDNLHKDGRWFTFARRF